MPGQYLKAAIFALASLTFSQPCLAGPATKALENYHGNEFPGRLSASSGLFDMAQVAPKIVGADEWAKATSQERQEYSDLMQKLLMANYAKQAREISKFKFVDETSEATEATVVASTIDVVDMDGISTVSIHRSQQPKIIRESGFQVLLQKIRDRLSKPDI